jgi:superfamily II DNA or RNA helicase
MRAHREACAIAVGTAGKLRVLADLLAQHHPARTLMFTEDTVMVYRVSREFLISAITHRFRTGAYPGVVISRVLNEGVDVPDASSAIVLSGTGSPGEYVQRLGRIFRRREGKLAVLYEVVAEATSEEQVARRRRQATHVSPERQLNLLEPDLLTADGSDESLDPRRPHRQEDTRSYPPSC